MQEQGLSRATPTIPRGEGWETLGAALVTLARPGDGMDSGGQMSARWGNALGAVLEFTPRLLESYVELWGLAHNLLASVEMWEREVGRRSRGKFITPSHNGPPPS